MDTNQVITYILTFVVVFGGYLFVQLFIDKPNIETLKPIKDRLPFLYRLSFGLLVMFQESLGGSIRNVKGKKQIEELETLLKMANAHASVELVYAAQGLFAILGFGVVLFGVAIIWGNLVMGVCGGLLFGFIGWVLPYSQIASMGRTRQAQIVRALPFAIDLLASAMRSGLDFSAAVNYYVRNERRRTMLGEEFNVMLRDMQLGKTRSEALASAADRIQADEFTSFAASIIHGTEIGAPVSLIIKVQGDEMRRRRYARAESQAAQAPAKMLFPMALFIFPAFFLMLAVPIYVQVMKSGML